jgi:hypothetical protein
MTTHTAERFASLCDLIAAVEYSSAEQQILFYTASTVSNMPFTICTHKCYFVTFLCYCPQVGMGSMDHYERDFEEVLLNDTAGYYKRKAAEWINEDSCPEYMLKVRDSACLLCEILKTRADW